MKWTWVITSLSIVFALNAGHAFASEGSNENDDGNPRFLFACEPVAAVFGSYRGTGQYLLSKHLGLGLGFHLASQSDGELIGQPNHETLSSVVTSTWFWGSSGLRRDSWYSQTSAGLIYAWEHEDKIVSTQDATSDPNSKKTETESRTAEGLIFGHDFGRYFKLKWGFNASVGVGAYYVFMRGNKITRKPAATVFGLADAQSQVQSEVVDQNRVLPKVTLSFGWTK